MLSDETKTHTVSETVSDNMNVLGDILCIKKGTDLTEQDFVRIKDFLKNSDSDVVIATDEKSVKTFKTAARITDEGEMEVFRATKADGVAKRQYTKEESRFIRSKLPFRHAFKLGASGLKLKPIRLFFTILLCTVAFVLFGMLSTLNFYNSEATFRQTMKDADISSIRLTKRYQEIVTWYQYGEEQDSYESYNMGRFSPAEVEEIAKKLNSNAFGGIEYGGNFSLSQPSGAYWQNNIRTMAALPEGNNLRERMQGEYPQDADEIAISSYFADMLVACKVNDDTGSSLNVQSTEALIGETISLGGYSYEITGIVDSGRIPARFDSLKENDNQGDYTLQYQLMSNLESGLHLLVFVSEDRLAQVAQEYSYYYKNQNDYMRVTAGFKYEGEYQLPDYGEYVYSGISSLASSNDLYYFDSNKTSLADGEVVISVASFANYAGNYFAHKADELWDENYELANQYGQLRDYAWSLQEGGTWEYDEEKDEHIFKPLIDEVYQAQLDAVITAIRAEEDIDLEFGMRLYDYYNGSAIGEIMEYEIAGIYRPISNDFYLQILYVSDNEAAALWDQQKGYISDYQEVSTNYVEAADAMFSFIYLPGNVSESKIDDYWEVYSNKEFDENSVCLYMNGDFIDSLQVVDSLVETLSQVFLYVGLVLAVFAALLLSNFISVSISNKKREIGILRAVGARSLDVFKIFFSESFVIGLICVALSSGISMWLCNTINMEYADELGVSVFVFGIPSLAVLVAIAAATIVIATFLPVYNAAKKKPVDSIRAL